MITSGIFLLDKPAGPTSHDAVLWARRALHQKRIGHFGTLDPMATGLLILGLGEALKWQDRLTGFPKIYRGRLRLGVTTDTDDITGRMLTENPDTSVSEQRLRLVFKDFEGELRQRVPRYSAVKRGGRRLYELARQGVSVELPEKTVQIRSFELLSCQGNEAEFRVHCSKGTYVRSLVRDVGEKMGTGATLIELQRESIGFFTRDGAYAWDGGYRGDGEELQFYITPLDRLSELLAAEK